MFLGIILEKMISQSCLGYHLIEFLYIFLGMSWPQSNLYWGVPVFIKFGQFSSELTKTWSSGATKCGVWIGNCNVKVWKSTEHKLQKMWCWLKFQMTQRYSSPLSKFKDRFKSGGATFSVTIFHLNPCDRLLKIRCSKWDKDTVVL